MRRRFKAGLVIASLIGLVPILPTAKAQTSTPPAQDASAADAGRQAADPEPPQGVIDGFRRLPDRTTPTSPASDPSKPAPSRRTKQPSTPTDKIVSQPGPRTAGLIESSDDVIEIRQNADGS